MTTRIEMGKYHVLGDGNSWILTRDTVREKRDTKQEYAAEETIGHYSSLDGIRGRLIELEVSNLGTVTAKQFVAALEEARDRVDGWLNG